MPMFYVEHQFLGIFMQISTKKPSSVDTFPCSTWNIAIFIFLALLFGCKENDPKPELKDSIYQDMTAQEAEDLIMVSVVLAMGVGLFAYGISLVLFIVALRHVAFEDLDAFAPVHSDRDGGHAEPS